MNNKKTNQQNGQHIDTDYVAHDNQIIPYKDMKGYIRAFFIVTVILILASFFYLVFIVFNHFITHKGTTYFLTCLREWLELSGKQNQTYDDILLPIIIAGIISVHGISVTTYVFLKSALDRRKDHSIWSVLSINHFQSCMSGILKKISYLAIASLGINLTAYSISYYCRTDVVNFITLSIATFISFTVLSITFWMKSFFYSVPMYSIALDLITMNLRQIEEFGSEMFNDLVDDYPEFRNHPYINEIIKPYFDDIRHDDKKKSKITAKDLFFKVEALIQPNELKYEYSQKTGNDYRIDDAEKYKLPDINEEEKKKEMPKGEWDSLNFHYAGLSCKDYEEYIKHIHSLLSNHYKNAFFFGLLDNEVRISKKFQERQIENDKIIICNVILYTVCVLYKMLASTTISKTDIQDMKLYYADLYHTRFINAKLNGVEMNNATLTRVSFENCELNRIGFIHSKLYHAIVKDCAMAYALFSIMDVKDEKRLEEYEKAEILSMIEDTTFDRVNLSDARFSIIRVQNTKFENSIFTGTIFELMDIIETSFNNCSMLSVEFYKATISNCSFNGASMENACFTPKYLEYKARDEYKMADNKEKAEDIENSTVSFDREDISKSQQNGENENVIAECDFYQANLSKCIIGYMFFDTCSFIEANMSGIRLVRVKMPGAILKRASMDNSKLHNVNLQNSLMNDAVLYSSEMFYVDFTCSYLIGVSAGSTKMERSVLNACNLSRSDFTRAEITDCRLRNSVLSDCDYTFATIIDSDFYATIADNLLITSATFKSDKFNKAILCKTIARSSTFYNCEFRNTVVRNSYLIDSNFILSDFQSTDLSDSTLNSVIFWGCKHLETVDFSGCQLNNVIIITKRFYRDLVHNLRLADNLENVIIGCKYSMKPRFVKIDKFRASVKKRMQFQGSERYVKRLYRVIPTGIAR